MLESRKRANKKWLKNNYEQIVIRVPRGTKDEIKKWAADSEMSMAAYIQAACREKSEKISKKGWQVVLLAVQYNQKETREQPTGQEVHHDKKI